VAGASLHGVNTEFRSRGKTTRERTGWAFRRDDPCLRLAAANLARAEAKLNRERCAVVGQFEK
jgi:hypothetical protein